MKQLQQQSREIERFTDIPKGTQEMFKERWQQELQDIEQRRNDLLREHQKLQKRWQKCKACRTERSSATKTLTNAPKWTKMEQVENEIAEGKARFQEQEDNFGRRGSG